MHALFSNNEMVPSFNETAPEQTIQISAADRQRQSWLDELAALGARYVAQLPAKIEAIETSWHAIERVLEAADSMQETPQNAPEISFFELYRAVHSLSGSGATYGFAAVSVAAKDLELVLLPLSESSTQIPALSPACRAEITEKIARLKCAIQSASA